ncbi:hypothetical protein PVAND_002872 [Polypedilum vanderplanki]|uniref:Bestrophin homolog n=1 Tax=Polypedilum vanderplanki TaxID=319348 RepID=A0A9J6BSR2_POLVA|nr:hypothetical protein PVAND_002872 [Polypedilum vanderplanki]
MTVTYTDQIATAKGLTLLKLMFFKWRGSLLRLVWKDLIVFVSIHYVIQIIYKYILNDDSRNYLDCFFSHVQEYQKMIPLSFVLGFFVSTVSVRWWNQFESIPWPTHIAVYVSSTLHGYDEVGRAMRRTILRYVNLSLVMVFRALSPRVKKRFPKMDDLITAGFINESELSVLQDIEKKYPGYNKNWLPICWAANLATRARDDGRIKDDFALKTIIEELNKFRAHCGALMNYAYICLPLVYIQVVTLATYTYFILLLIQIPRKNENEGSFNFLPILISLQFVFYMGWLKVAETMINPFGDDDDDFEVNNMIDKNLIISYLIVDIMHDDHPELLKDQYWDGIPSTLPDRGRVHPKDFEISHITDFFDVKDENDTKTTPVAYQDANQEANRFSMYQVKFDQIPRSSVIDETYRRVSNVEISQSHLQRQMQKAREKVLSRQISYETSTETLNPHL